MLMAVSRQPVTFRPRPVYVGFVVDKVTLGYFFSKYGSSRHIPARWPATYDCHSWHHRSLSALEATKYVVCFSVAVLFTSDEHQVPSGIPWHVTQTVTTPTSVRWTGRMSHVCHMYVTCRSEGKCVLGIPRKHGGKRELRSPRCSWQDNIKRILRKQDDRLWAKFI